MLIIQNLIKVGKKIMATRTLFQKRKFIDACIKYGLSESDMNKAINKIIFETDEGFALFESSMNDYSFVSNLKKKTKEKSDNQQLKIFEASRNDKT